MDHHTKQASIHFFRKKGKYLIHTISTFEIGAGIASDPFIWVDENANNTQIVTAVLRAFNESTTGLPTPESWDDFSKKLLTKIGLKNKSDLQRDVVHVGVARSGDIIYFTPTVNNGVSGGFQNISRENIEIKATQNIDEIAGAIQNALALSK